MFGEELAFSNDSAQSKGSSLTGKIALLKNEIVVSEKMIDEYANEAAATNSRINELKKILASLKAQVLTLKHSGLDNDLESAGLMVSAQERATAKDEIARLKDLIKDSTDDIYENDGLAQTCSNHLVEQRKSLKLLEREKVVRRRTNFPPTNTNLDITTLMQNLPRRPELSMTPLMK